MGKGGERRREQPHGEHAPCLAEAVRQLQDDLLAVLAVRQGALHQVRRRHAFEPDARDGLAGEALDRQIVPGKGNFGELAIFRQVFHRAVAELQHIAALVHRQEGAVGPEGARHRLVARVVGEKAPQLTARTARGDQHGHALGDLDEAVRRQRAADEIGGDRGGLVAVIALGDGLDEVGHRHDEDDAADDIDADGAPEHRQAAARMDDVELLRLLQVPQPAAEPDREADEGKGDHQRRHAQRRLPDQCQEVLPLGRNDVECPEALPQKQQE